MNPESKKYLRNRRQIINLITEIEVVYEDDDIRVTSYPDFWKSRDAADKILSRLGINKPNEIKEVESESYSLT